MYSYYYFPERIFQQISTWFKSSSSKRYRICSACGCRNNLYYNPMLHLWEGTATGLYNRQGYYRFIWNLLIYQYYFICYWCHSLVGFPLLLFLCKAYHHFNKVHTAGKKTVVWSEFFSFVIDNRKKGF